VTTQDNLQVRQSRLEIAEGARAMFRGVLSFIEGARRLHDLKANGMLADDHPGFDTFIGLF
jgi:hypothetical protein